MVARQKQLTLAAVNNSTFPLNLSQLRSRAVSFNQNLKHNKTVYLLVLLLGLALLFYYKRGWFIAATVNGAPVTNIELLAKMNQLYRSQTLSQVIDEKLIAQEAAKKHIVVTDQDVSDRVAQIEKSFGGSGGLDMLLSQQGQSRQILKDQLKYQLLVEKLYQDQATVSAQEIDQFITSNKDSLKSTDSAKQRQEAENLIKQQKLAQIFQDKFKQLKDAAKIRIF